MLQDSKAFTKSALNSLPPRRIGHRKYWMYMPIIVLGRVLATWGVLRDNTGSFEVTLAA